MTLLNYRFASAQICRTFQYSINVAEAFASKASQPSFPNHSFQKLQNAESKLEFRTLSFGQAINCSLPSFR